MSLGFIDLVKLANCDYKTCIAMEAHFPDEFAVRTALYHLQQAVEKNLQAIILCNGECPYFTHDIDKLARQCKSLGQTFSDKLDIIADSLTLWENKSRYDPSINFSKTKYSTAKDFYEETREMLLQSINANEFPEEMEPIE